MKRLTCEMCGGNDLVKDGGLFVCQHCGCKYTVEEARKMMVEGTVDVVVDKTSEIENLTKYADREFDDAHNENAAKIYDQILGIDPDNLHAMYRKALVATLLMNVDYLQFTELDKACKRVIQIAHERYGETEDYFDFCRDMIIDIAIQMNRLAQMYIILFNKAMKLNFNPIRGVFFRKSLHKHTSDICAFTMGLLTALLGQTTNFDNSNESFWMQVLTMYRNIGVYCNNAKMPLPENYQEYEKLIRGIADSRGVNLPS